MAFHSDYEEIFIRREEVSELLDKAGFPLDSAGSETSPEESEEPARPVQNWMRLYAAKSSLRLYEAAFILHSKEPPMDEPRNISAEPAEVSKSKKVLFDLVVTGDISTFNTAYHIDDEPSTWLLDHDSILEWCRRTGYKWPLSDLKASSEEAPSKEGGGDRRTAPPSGAATEELHQRLASLEEEVRALQEKVETLSTQVPLHPGGLMGMAIQVQHDYWQSPNENRPKSDAIVHELRSRNPEISNAEAKAVEKVACPISRKR